MVDNTPDNSEEVRPARRRFTIEFKRNLLAEIDNAKTSDEVGLILRREGLHTTHVAKWRREQRAGTLGAKKRGKPARDDVQRRNDELEKENADLKDRLALAEELIEAQGKVHALLHAASGKSASQKSPR
jgi:transposase